MRQEGGPGSCYEPAGWKENSRGTCSPQGRLEPGMWLWMNGSQFHYKLGQGWCGNLSTESSTRGRRVRVYPQELLQLIPGEGSESWGMGGRAQPCHHQEVFLVMLGETLCRPSWLQLLPASIEAAGKVLVSAGRMKLRKEIGFPVDQNSSGLENCIFQGQLGGHHFYPLTDDESAVAQSLGFKVRHTWVRMLLLSVTQ